MPAVGEPPLYDQPVPERLYFTDSDEANELIAKDPMALLIGFRAGPAGLGAEGVLRARWCCASASGRSSPAILASSDLEPVFRAKPAIHRFPGAMARRVHDLAVHICDRYAGDAARVWTDAADGDALRANLAALPGYGEMKVKALGSVLAKRFDVEAARELVPWHPTLGDVDSREALERYQAAKRAHKAEWSKNEGGGLSRVTRACRRSRDRRPWPDDRVQQGPLADRGLPSLRQRRQTQHRARFIRAVGGREYLVRDSNAQPLADRLPAIRGSPLQQPAGWNARAYLSVMALEGIHHRGGVSQIVGEALAKHPANRREPLLEPRRWTVKGVKDRVGSASVPGIGVPRREQHERIGICGRDLTPEGGSGQSTSAT